VTTYFVSGHLDLTDDEFAAHYAPRLRDAIAGGASFVVGDARGCAALTQAFLAAAGCASVRVFHMLIAPRHNHGFPCVGGFAGDRDRDAAMTAASDDDIAWIRPGREHSGTARNLARRGG
jgi:hypothetical protein